MVKQWYKLNPINGMSEVIGKNDVEAFISMKAINKNDINLDSGTPIKCRKDIWVINNLTTKEQIDVVRNEFFDPNERWKKIDVCTKPYYISTLGRVKVKYKNGKEKVLSQYAKSGRKKLMVKLPVGDKKYKEFHIHQLVALAFVPNPNNYECTYHKDHDIFNNRCNNIGWIDRSELGKLTGGLTNSMPVFKKDAKTKEIIEWYESMAEAGRQNYLHRETIRMCVAGELKTAGGFLWEIDKELMKDKNKLRGIM